MPQNESKVLSHQSLLLYIALPASNAIRSVQVKLAGVKMWPLVAMIEGLVVHFFFFFTSLACAKHANG